MREAQAYLTRKLRERDLGRDLEGTKITLNEYLDRWFETAVRPRVRVKTFQDYQGVLRRYIRPILGERVLAGMRPLELQSIYHQMSGRGLYARTVRRSHHETKCGALTVDQARTLLKAAQGTKYGPVLAVALTTGMRPSEYLGLKWKDIDWARQSASIVRSIRRLNEKWCFSDMKRSRSRRPIKLQSWIVALLRDLQAKASAHDLYPEAHDLVFRTPSGQPINADYVAKRFRSNTRPRRYATNEAL